MRKNHIRSRVTGWVHKIAPRYWLLAGLAIGTFVLANPFPGLWSNGTGQAIHYPPVAWPAAPGDWKPYTRFGHAIADPRTQDPSNGGTAPQNYVNISSSCSDKSAPSTYYYLHRGATAADDVLMFRWRVEQPAHNYATGPSPGNYSSSSPWSSAQWTVLFDLDGSGYRTLAAHLNGSSGSPAEPVDMLVGIWSRMANQSIDYADPNVRVLAHNPTAFVGPGNRLMNFHGSLSPDESWPNGSAETQWDYGTTRATLVTSSPCVEYFIDYQIPVAMLDASGAGGPKITRDTPIALLFCTANSLSNPFQKDCAINRQWNADASAPAPFGDYLSFNKADPYRQPIVASITATPPASCPGSYTLNARVQDALAVRNGVVVPTVKAVKFFYWRDRDGDGTATAGDSGSAWTAIAGTPALVAGTLNSWSGSWDATALPKGKYLVGAQAVDDNSAVDDGMTPTGVDNRTFSYLPGDADNEIYVGGAWKGGQQALFPGHSPAQAPGTTEDWFGNPDVTGTQVAVVGTAINACGIAPTLTLSASLASVAAGGTVAFTLTIANPGANANAITVDSVSDVLPPGFAYVNGSASGSGGLPSINPTIAGQTLTWTLGAPLSLSPGASATLAFDSTSGSVAGRYSSTAAAGTSFGALASAPASVTVDSARLSLSIVPNANSIAADGSTALTYTLRYADDSAVNVTGATIVSTLPAGVTYQSCTGGTCGNTAGTISWVLGDLAAAASGTATLTITVPSNYSSFSLAESATLSATAPDGATVSASAAVSVAVTGVSLPGTPGFTLTKSSSVASVAPGGNVTYTLTYANYGSATGTSVTLTDTLPAGMSFSSCSDSCSSGSGTVTWSIGSVAAGAGGSRTLTLAAATPFTAANPTTNVASLAWTGGTPVTARAVVGVTGQSCSTYYYRNGTAGVGFDGTQRIASISPVPVPGDSGSTISATAPVSGSAFLEVLRFYQDPQAPNDVPFDGNITSNIYIDRANGQGLNIRATVYDYDTDTGGKVQLAQKTTLFNGSTKGLLTDTITPSGTLAKSHRLLWVYEARSANGSQTVQVQFQFGGTVTNGISGGTTFANSNAAFCVTPPASLTLATRVSAASVLEGTTPRLTYTLDYANTGSASATSAALTGALPTGFTGCEYSTNGSTWSACSSVGGSPPSHAFALGTLAGGATGTVYVRGDVPAGTTAPATLSAASSLVSAQTSAVAASAETLITAAAAGGTPALTLALGADRSAAAPGAAVTYTVTVINTGSAAASNVVVSDTVPAAAYYSYAGCTGGCVPSGATLTWPTIATLAAGASQTYTYSMLVGTSGLPNGITQIADDAGATGNAGLSATSNSVTVTLSGNPLLSLLNNVAPGSGVTPGDALTYTLTLINSGAADAQGVHVENPIPAHTSYDGTVGASQGSAAFDPVGNRVVFDVGTLASGASVTLTFTARIVPSLAAGTTVITSTATAGAANAAERITSVSVNASAAPVLAILQTAPDSVPYPSAVLTAGAVGTLLSVDRSDRLQIGQLISVGGQVARIVARSSRSVQVDVPIAAANGTAVIGAVPISIAYRNDGDAPASAVSIEEGLATGFVYQASEPLADSAPATGVSGAVTWNLGTLPGGSSGTLKLLVFPSGAMGSFVNGVDISAGNAPTASDATTTAVGGIAMIKSSSTARVSAGGIAQYTIVASNSLASVVTPLAIMDKLPQGFTYRAGSALVGGVSVEPTFDPADTALSRPTWSALSVPAGGSLTIAFAADVAADAGAGSYQNEVDVQAPGGVGLQPFDALSSAAEDVTVLAAGSGVVQGRVFARAGGNSTTFDPLTDTPLAGVRVEIHKSGADCNNPVGNNCFVAYTDADGAVERTVAVGDWIVSVVPSGELSAGWFQIAGTNDNTVSVADQGVIADGNGYSSNAPPTHLVSATAGANGGISPASRTVVDGDTTSFTVTPDSGYVISSVSGCGGSLSGSTFTTAAISGACTVSAAFVSASVPTFLVSTSAGAGGTVAPASQLVATGNTASFTISPDVGYGIASVSGCGGSLSGNSFTTAPVSGACTVAATFAANSYLVSASAGAGGGIAPASASVSHGATASFTVTPLAGYDVLNVSGCGGSLSGNTYTTGAVTADCAIGATFVAQGIPVYAVSAVAGTGGAIAPAAQNVAAGGTAALSVTADAGYEIAAVGGCGGSLSGSTYTTAAIGGACTVVASFSRIQFTVGASAGAGGTITPASTSVSSGDSAAFTVAADPGYSVAAVAGCGGSLSGSTYTTAAVAADCAVVASFSPIQFTVGASSGAGGTITPASAAVSPGDTASFAVAADAGYSIASAAGCGGSLTGSTYTTAAVGADCAVVATFARNSYVVSTAAGSGGAITPPSSSVYHGDTAGFTLTPDGGYRIGSVTGCGGALSGNTFTTAAVTGACAVTAIFVRGGPAFEPAAPARIDARGLLTQVPMTIAPRATDDTGHALVVELVGEPRLRPGRHTLEWRAVDSHGVEVRTTQRFDVWPMATAGEDLVLGFGRAAAFDVYLNGEAPEYPYSVPFGVMGDGLGTLHSLASGIATFAAGTHASVAFQTLPQTTSFPTRHLTVSLQAAANPGARSALDVSLVSQNAAPSVHIEVTQDGRAGAVVTRDGGPVVLRAAVADPNAGDSHAVVWAYPAGASPQVSTDGLSLTVAPSSLTGNFLDYGLSVTDSGMPALTARAKLTIAVRATSPTLGAGDGNGNGVSDADDGWGDSGNGVPDYLQRSWARSVLPEDGPVTDRYLVEGAPDVSLRLGIIAALAGTGGARIEPATAVAMTAADSIANVGGLFSVAATDIAADGNVVMVLPQRAAVPQNALYRLWDPALSRWVTFAENGNNRIASAPGEPGYCPAPGSAQYRPGLIAGDLCVQITLEDGGVNDSDKMKNGTLSTFGGVAVTVESVVTGTSRGSGGGGRLGIECALLALLVLWRAVRPALRRGWGIALIVPVLAQAQVGPTSPAGEDAAARWGWFVSAEGALVRNAHGASDMDAALAAQGYTTHTALDGQSRLGSALSIGWRRGRLALELGYIDLGRMDTRVSSLTPVDDAFLTAVSAAHPRSGEGPQLRAQYSWPWTRTLELYGRAGMFQWRNAHSAEAGTQESHGAERRIDPTLGLGLSYRQVPRWQLSGGFDVYRLDGEALSALSLGVRYFPRAAGGR